MHGVEARQRNDREIMEFMHFGVLPAAQREAFKPRASLKEPKNCSWIWKCRAKTLLCDTKGGELQRGAYFIGKPRKPYIHGYPVGP